MAKGSNSVIGGTLGVVLGLALVGGIAGTPFYLSRLRSEARTLDARVQDDVEAIRRIVLHIDENLAAMKDLRDIAGKDNLLSPESVGDLEKAHPKIYDAVSGKLDATAAVLRKAVRADQKRGTTPAAKATIATGPPNGRQAVQALEGKYLPETDQLLAKARTIAARLVAIREGNEAAGSNLAVNRILAILNLTDARIQANRAELQRRQAEDMYAAAEDRLHDVALVRLAETRLDAERPNDQLAALEQSITQGSALIGQLDAAISQIEGIIADKETALAEKRQEAAEAREKLTELTTKGFTSARPDRAGDEFAGFRDDYLRLAAAAREARAAAEALENGTLKGATLSDDADGDLLHGAYDGGVPDIGLRDLRHHLATVKATRSSQVRTQSDLEAEKAGLAAERESLAAARSEVSETVLSRADEIAATLDQARDRHEAFEQTSSAAIATFQKAGQFAKAALTAAKARTRLAREAMSGSSGSVIEHPFKRIAADKEVEASLHMLAGEITYRIALVQRGRIEARQARYRAALVLSKLAGRATPEAIDDDIDALRGQAEEALTRANDSYTTAAGMLKTSRATLPGGSVAGEQYVWQVQLGQASVHLLRSELAVDLEAARSDRKQAYELLTEAVRGREQSPLLLSAADALLYLQHTAE